MGLHVDYGAQGSARHFTKTLQRVSNLMLTLLICAKLLAKGKKLTSITNLEVQWRQENLILSHNLSS